MVLRGLYGKGARADVGCRLQGETHLNTVGAFEDHPACQPASLPACRPANLPANRNARPEACFLSLHTHPRCKSAPGKGAISTPNPLLGWAGPFPRTLRTRCTCLHARNGGPPVLVHRLVRIATACNLTLQVRASCLLRHTASCRTSHLHAATSCAHCPAWPPTPHVLSRCDGSARVPTPTFHLHGHCQHRCISISHAPQRLSFYALPPSIPRESAWMA